MEKQINAINWNAIEDMIDKATWEKLTEQFWLDTRIPVANDVSDWNTLTAIEKTLFNKVFGGLTLLDTMQSTDGVACLYEYATTEHEEAVLNNIKFMESVHAKSYSTIFSTLCTPQEIDDIFCWVRENKYLQYKAQRIEEVYQSEGMELEKKATSVLLESFLFYSGFYTSLWYLGKRKMVHTAEIIKLIIRDESVHGTYIGYKFRKTFKELTQSEQSRIKDWVMDFAYDLWENECAYVVELYTEVDQVAEVNLFLEYNLNKALSNLGFDPMFATTAKDIDPIVLNGLSTASSNHDFFSVVGDSYLMGEVEVVSDSDYDIINSLVNN